MELEKRSPCFAFFYHSVPSVLCLSLSCRGALPPFVTVTLLTVIVFLGPALGYKSQLSGAGFYYHLVGPLLAIVSFCFLERVFDLSFVLSLLGIVPVLLYGLFYLYKVVLCPEEKRWEDFYGYNKSGKWPISFAAMMVGAFVICLLLRLLYLL